MQFYLKISWNSFLLFSNVFPMTEFLKQLREMGVPKLKTIAFFLLINRHINLEESLKRLRMAVLNKIIENIACVLSFCQQAKEQPKKWPN